MAERITKADLEAVTENLNRRLEGMSSTSRIAVSGRYDYTAVDEIAASDGHIIRGPLTAGTKREVYDALWNMIRGIDIANTR